MENMRDIQEERKRIRQQLDMAYNEQDKEELIKAAKSCVNLLKGLLKLNTENRWRSHVSDLLLIRDGFSISYFFCAKMENKCFEEE